VSASGGRVFFDTSVLLAGLIDFGDSSLAPIALLDRVAAGRVSRPTTAWHCYLELFSVATRLPEEFRLTPADARRLLDEEVLARFEVLDLPADRRGPLFAEAESEAFTGGRIYDAEIGAVAPWQKDVEDTGRFNVDGVYRRFLPDRWFWQAFATLDGNDELGLDLRTTVGGAYGRFVSQTPQQEWAAYAGLAVTLIGQPAQPGFPGRNNGDLRHRKHSVRDQQQEYDGDFKSDLLHNFGFGKFGRHPLERRVAGRFNPPRIGEG